MNEETFNMSMRKFLKTVGVTSQQKIEEAVRGAGADLGDSVQVKMVLTIEGMDMEHVVTGTIHTGDAE